MPRLNRREIRTPNAPTPAFSYSQGIIFQDLLFNVAAVAAQAGTSLKHALRVNVYLDDLSCIEEFDEVYRMYFTEPYPARTTVQAGLRGYLVEIDAIVAIAGEGSS